MRVCFGDHSLPTRARGHFIDLASDVQDMLRRTGVVSGMALVYSPHATCSIVMSEHESGLRQDLRGLTEALVPAEARTTATTTWRSAPRTSAPRTSPTGMPTAASDRRGDIAGDPGRRRPSHARPVAAKPFSSSSITLVIAGC
jgi:hypothetical protein